MKVRTTEPVQHDGKNIEVGSVIDVSKAVGEQLIEAKAAEPVGKASAADGQGAGQ